MDITESVLESGQPITEEVPLLEPFISAVRAALSEMAATDVSVRAMVRSARPIIFGDIASVVPFPSMNEGALVLGFPHQTASALTGRILASASREDESPTGRDSSVGVELDEGLIRDCMGEIANVVTGQAKAVLAETPYRFTFSRPPSVLAAEEFQVRSDLDCLLLAFACDQGQFAMHLMLCLASVLKKGP